MTTSIFITPLLLLTLFGAADVLSSESIGTYNDGSIIDSVALERNAPGIQAVNLWREHNYGHKNLKNFIKELGKKSFQNNLGQLLIGDLSARAGGKLPGHASHQNGLDVDIWFYRPDDSITNLPDNERDAALFPHYLNPRTNSFYPGKWDQRLDFIIKATAEDKRVARIFVNPGVKKRLCTLFPNQEFLKKVRPWFRHHEHFHVRLKCPENSPKCKNQEPSTAIECSGEDFDWWFSEDFTREYDRRYGKKNKSNEICDH